MPVRWEDILVRALISAAAGAASTGAIVATAENGPGLPKKKKKRKKKGSRKGKEGASRAAGAASGKQERPAKKPPPPVDTGAWASRHLEASSDAGLSTEEFLSNLRSGAEGLGQKAGRLLGLGSPAPGAPDADEPAAPARQRKKGPQRRAKGRPARGRRRPQTSQDGLDALKEEALYYAKDRVKKKVVEATGVGDKYDAIRGTAEDIGERASDVGRRLRDSAQEGARTIGTRAGGVAKGSRDFASHVIERIPEDTTKEVGDGLKGVGRWLQGPGAQNYDEERLDPAQAQLEAPEPEEEGEGQEPERDEDDDGVVEAKIDDSAPEPIRRHRLRPEEPAEHRQNGESRPGDPGSASGVE